MLTTELTRELYNDGISPIEAKEALVEARDSTVTKMTAKLFGNEYPRPPKKFGYDISLYGTNTYAYYVDPKEIKELNPYFGNKLERELGSDPVQAYNPIYVKIRRKNPRFAKAIDAHEKVHGAQPGKSILKRIGVLTIYGPLPLGEMIIEGSAERALEKSGIKPPSRYFDSESGKSAYSIYRDFVYDLENASPGITRQIFRAAKKGGVNSVIRLIENVPYIDRIVTKYARDIHVNSRTN
jgi:hypothetical protein